YVHARSQFFPGPKKCRTTDQLYIRIYSRFGAGSIVLINLYIRLSIIKSCCTCFYTVQLDVALGSKFYHFLHQSNDDLMAQCSYAYFFTGLNQADDHIVGSMTLATTLRPLTMQYYVSQY